jgi:dihydrofolate reductase
MQNEIESSGRFDARYLDGDEKMGRIVATVMMSLNGVTESPGDWGMRYFDEDAQRDSLKRLMISDAMLMGRLTYEALGAAWSQRQGAFADRINAIRKYVFSSTMQVAAPWANSLVVAGNVVEETRKLKTK